MNKRIFLDIETLPPSEDARERVEHIVLREQAEKEESLESLALARLVDSRFRELALQAEHGRLLAVGVIIEEGGRVLHHGVLGRDRATMRFHLDEARTLGAFWRLIANFDAHHDLIVGHNILDFDLPFLCKRSAINRVRPSVDFCFRRYRRQPIFDTMWEWNNWRRCIKLHELAEALGIESPKTGDLDGSRVYDYFIEGRHEELARYCVRDVECVREIYYRLTYQEAPPIVLYEAKSPVPLVTGAGTALTANALSA